MKGWDWIPQFSFFECSVLSQLFHSPLSLSCTGEGNGNPLQCSCLENPRDRGVWWAAVYEVMHSWAQLKWLSSSSSYLEANMVPYSRSFSSDFCFCYAMMNDTKLLVGKSLGSLWIKPLYKKDLHDPDNHDGVITHLEPNILEYEVKWALGSIIMNNSANRLPLKKIIDM